MLYVKLYEFMNHIETEYKSLMDDTGLNLIEVHVLRALYECDGQRPSDLSMKVSRSRLAFTPILDRLEGKGFIERKPDAEDRRSVRVYLTAIGESQRQNIVQYAEEADEQLEAEMYNFLPSEDEFMGDDRWTESNVFIDDIVGYPTTQYPASS